MPSLSVYSSTSVSCGLPVIFNLSILSLQNGQDYFQQISLKLLPYIEFCIIIAYILFMLTLLRSSLLFFSHSTYAFTLAADIVAKASNTPNLAVKWTRETFPNLELKNGLAKLVLGSGYDSCYYILHESVLLFLKYNILMGCKLVLCGTDMRDVSVFVSVQLPTVF